MHKLQWFPSFVVVFAFSFSFSSILSGQKDTLESRTTSRTDRIEAFFLAAPSSLDSTQASKRRFFGELEFRTIDGSQNNQKFFNWGRPGEPLRRISRSAYSDFLSAPAGADRRSPREISNLIADQPFSVPNQRGLTSMVWQWGQFLDHDIDLTEAAVPAEPFPIQVPRGDIFFDPFATGTVQIQLFRSEYSHDTGIKAPREQLNQITAWIDGSNVYGSDEQTCNSLRLFKGGRMATSKGGLLPQDSGGFFLAGDIRANEQNGLTCMHTLFVREHNRIADQIARNNPTLNDEAIFLLARREVIGIIQSITYNEFLPALLGPNALRPYRNYRPEVDPQIRNEFSTAAYRVGHTMLTTHLWRLEENGEPIAAGHLALQSAFFNPQEIVDHGIEPYLRGLVYQQAEEIDNLIVDDVRNFLFGIPGSGGFDLASLNIQRGRDHGLCDLNAMRVDYGLSPCSDFSDVTSDRVLQKLLAECCDGNIDDVDAWVGMLAEDHLPDASVGETIHTILVRQFEDLRDGDRFWYQRNFVGDELRRIESTRLADVIKRNTNIRNLPPQRLSGKSQTAISQGKIIAAWIAGTLHRFRNLVPEPFLQKRLPTPDPFLTCDWMIVQNVVLPLLQLFVGQAVRALNLLAEWIVIGNLDRDLQPTVLFILKSDIN